MGVIKKRSTGEFVLLNCEHVFGRNGSRVNTVIQGFDVSRSHATIRWRRRQWVLQDHSMNGTLVNNIYGNQKAIPLKQGDMIKFGQGGLAEWELIDGSPPASYLRSLTFPDNILVLAERPGIPAPDHSEISFYLGRDKRWKAESSNLVIDLVDGIKLKFGDQEWRFFENGTMETTQNLGNNVDNAHVLFKLSPDEEQLTVSVNGKGWTLDLGERAHHSLLLALARKRLQDIENGFQAEDAGWMNAHQLRDDLEKELRREVDEYQINLHIHRLRKQLLKQEPFGYLFTNLVERRRGELRFSHPYIQIVKEGKTMGSYLP